MEELFFTIFEALPRQGPGVDACTEKAFRKLADLPEQPEILDVGCGTGKQTLALARLTTGTITALDFHAPFIETLNNAALREGLSDRIHTVVGDMGAMDFKDGSFDLMWSEGAAYSIGYDNALKSWKRFLRPGGYLVTSELVWFKENAPKEVRDFFAGEYPAIRYYPEVISAIKSIGYELIDYFALPDEAWWTDYYTPMLKKVEEMEYLYRDDPEARKVFDACRLETEMHRKYSEYYGYEFFIMIYHI